MNIFAIRFSILAAIGLVLGGQISPAAAEDLAATPSSVGARVVFQVSDADPGKWNLLLNNAANAQKSMAKTLVAEIVVFGPGIGMLENDSPVAGRIQTALTNGIKVVACENTMAALKLTHKDMLPGIGFVPAGVVELIERQQQGYAYIRP